MTLTSNTTAFPSAQEQIAPRSSDGNRIKKLPPLLVNQLAAGEVVTRPASVVKELIENAIDAGAKNIDIRITQGGMGIIEVADDGCGIHPDDMIMAVTRFATSKIADVAHLQGIATLGFRGEALAATAAVSRLTLTSCSNDSGIGRELNVAGILEDTPQMTPVVHPKGTTVRVKDLYFNVPARRGNLKSISTEYAHIEMVVKQLALVASDISFTLWHNDKRRFSFESIVNSEADSKGCWSSTSSETRQSAVMQSVLNRLTALIPTSHDQTELFSANNLQSVAINLEGLHPHQSFEDSGQQPLSINGFLIPSCRALSNSSYKLIYINGRLVKDRRIAQSIRESAAHLADVHSVGYVLFFNLPKAWLNLNVHPTKQCIKIQNLANVMAHLEVGIRDALQLWQHRQPRLSHSNKQRVSSADQIANVADQPAASKMGLVASNPMSSHEPVYSYQYDAKTRPQSHKSNLNGFNTRQWHLVPESVTTSDSQYFILQHPYNRFDHGSFNTTVSYGHKADFTATPRETTSYPHKLNSRSDDGNNLTCLGIITNKEVSEGLLQQIRIKSVEPLDSEVYLFLIQFNQRIYLFSAKGLQAVLQQSQAVTASFDFTELVNTKSNKFENLAAVNTMLESLISIEGINYEVICSEHALTSMAISELFMLMVSSL